MGLLDRALGRKAPPPAADQADRDPGPRAPRGRREAPGQPKRPAAAAAAAAAGRSREPPPRAAPPPPPAVAKAAVKPAKAAQEASR